MIPNLIPLENAPLARTNRLLLDETSQALLDKLLQPVSDLYAIDYVIRQFPKQKNESHEDYGRRRHREFRAHVRRTLELAPKAEPRYELLSLGQGEYICLYLRDAMDVDEQALQATAVELLRTFESREIESSRLFQGLISIHLKIGLLEKAAEHHHVAIQYLNAALYIGARITSPITKKTGSGILEAFELRVFVSRQLEVFTSLHKRKFTIREGDNSAVIDDPDSTLLFQLDGRRLIADKQEDARDSKLAFYQLYQDYRFSQSYNHNLVMDLLTRQLDELTVSYSAPPFQAAFEIDHFITEPQRQRTNALYVVNAGVDLSLEQLALLKELMDEVFGSVPPFLNIDDFKEQHKSLLHQPRKEPRRSYLVLSPSPSSQASSITYLKEGDDKPKRLNTWIQALAKQQKDPTISFDFYTDLKLSQFISALNGKDSRCDCLQGWDLDPSTLGSLDYLLRIRQEDPELYAEQRDNSKSGISKARNAFLHPLRRIATELWFKERLFSQGEFELPIIPDGEYELYYIRSSNEIKGELIAITLFSVLNGQLNIKQRNILQEADLELLGMECPAFERLDRLYDGSVYLYHPDSDLLLTSYNSSRIPMLIGNAEHDPVSLYAEQEAIRAEYEAADEEMPASENHFGRSSADNRNPLPYYFTTGRRKGDPLKIEKMAKHRVFLMPQPPEQPNSTLVFVSDAQPPNTVLDRQITMQNLLIIDNDGKAVDPIGNPLAGCFLNTFTLDLLRSGNSSRSSILEKIAKLPLEN